MRIGGVRGVVARTEEALLLARPQGEDDRPLGLDGAGRDGLGDVQDADRAGAVVVGAVVDVVLPTRRCGRSGRRRRSTRP